MPASALVLSLSVSAVLHVSGAPARTAQTAIQIEEAVARALTSEGDLRRIEVSAEGREVTLTGPVPTFWAKSQAIEKALAVSGVETVVSELGIPRVEDEGALAQDVVQAILGYSRYTMWDFIQVSLLDGVVTLAGSVTPDGNKAGDLLERVAKTRGVQEVRDGIERQPVSGMDDELRRALAATIFSHDLFLPYSTLTLPPFHVVVANRDVRLVGMVRDDTEKRVLGHLARQTFGVREVINELETRQ